MNRVLLALSVIVAGMVYLLAIQFQLMPSSIGTAVIGEKPGKTMGNQIVVKLPESLSAKQARLLEKAYMFAKKEGFKNPEIIQGLLLQETLAGGLKSYKVANPGPEAYYGVGQLKITAAKDVLAAFPAIYEKYDFHTRTDDEIKANLILNEDFNIEVATKYIKLLHDRYNYRGRALLVAYNRGPSGAKGIDPDTFHYAIGAENKLQRFKSTGKVS